MAIAITVLVVILVLISAAFAFISTRPDTFRVERSAQIDAPVDVVFPIINDLHQWNRWSPYDSRDPNMKKTFDGASEGPGAIYTWSGNKNVGEGRMTILDSKPGEYVSMRLEFFKPFVGTNQVTFKLTPAGGGSRVSWIMDGKYNVICKAMSAFMDMDKMCGKDFEQGLANLNAVAQTEAQVVH